ncbi:hypothetical protein [Pseudomonas sp.]|uniref:hypothetical protein n=1 Tax=Pseudomonas sp. TaxID=306 RepID=UPI0028AC244C|nr:hypothetical protein [Pseudomonas sp.]
MDTKSAFFKINLVFLIVAVAVGSYAYLARSGAGETHDAALQAWASLSATTAPVTGEACEPGKPNAAAGEENPDCLIQHQANSTYRDIIGSPAAGTEQKAIVKK